MKVKTITLPVYQWEAISRAVSDYDDRGPEGEGWKSRELSQAEASLNENLKNALEVEI